MDHVKELQGRLFIVAVAFILVAGAAYPFFDKIVNFLLAPLGKNHELVYLTPGGAFGFIIQVCMYVGFVGALPVMTYHLYKFLLPAVRRESGRRVLLYTVVSFILALVGIAFAYFVSLPAALYFLTGFDLYHISPMLTIDSYFGFVMAYMVAGALLFQLPLVMIVIDSVKPQSPKGLMKYQKHIIVGSFAVAAIISPTPDALNQLLLASPMVVMYQVGIIAVWLIHRKDNKHPKKTYSQAVSVVDVSSRQMPETPVSVAQESQTLHRDSSVSRGGGRNDARVLSGQRRRYSMDGMIAGGRQTQQLRTVARLSVGRSSLRNSIPQRSLVTVSSSGRTSGRSLDGLLPIGN